MPGDMSVAGGRSRSRLFLFMGAVALSAMVLGFGGTYFLPVAQGTFAGPWWLQLHGALAIGWVLMFALQPILVHTRQLRWHRRLGLAAMPLAVAVALTMIPAGLTQVRRELAMGVGEPAISTLLGVFTSGALFVGLVVAGYRTRRTPEAHARWMLLATLVVIWPAWFRFRHWLPWVPRPDIWLALVLADVWIVLAMIHDRVVRGAVHPVLLWGGLFVILEQTAEVLLFDSPPWRAVAHTAWRVLGP